MFEIVFAFFIFDIILIIFVNILTKNWKLETLFCAINLFHIVFAMDRGKQVRLSPQ